MIFLKTDQQPSNTSWHRLYHSMTVDLFLPIHKTALCTAMIYT